MTKEEAKKILTEYQSYRRAEPPYDGWGVKFRYTPTEIGKALDVAINNL